MILNTEKIKATRERLGLTQGQAAERMGVARSYWSELESGRRDPRLSTLEGMALALGLTVAGLLDEGKR